jgi:hypothetical protein
VADVVVAAVVVVAGRAELVGEERRRVGRVVVGDGSRHAGDVAGEVRDWTRKSNADAIPSSCLSISRVTPLPGSTSPRGSATTR